MATTHPDTPLPNSWNPLKPLQLSDEVTPLTRWKLRRTANNAAACLSAIESKDVQRLSPLQETDVCGIDPRVRLSAADSADIAPLETSCAIALRTILWDRHSVQPAARSVYGVGVSRINHLSSYSCREIRTPNGSGGRMSTHATAEAIDIAGFVLDTGETISLLSDWHGGTKEQAFLRRVRDGACDWFATTLGPDFNSLHADHFHLQSRGWGRCQ
ncbi:MAG: extensin family protein [Boseongicola sp.]|nr:extensin family protein [Boseongicola sp.]